MIGWLPMHVRHLIGSLENGGAERFLVRLVAGIQEREPTWRQSVWTLTSRAALAPDVQRTGSATRTFAGGKSIQGLVTLASLPAAMTRESCSLVQCWMYHAEVMGMLSRLRGMRAPQIWTLRQSRLSGDVNNLTTRLLMRVSAWGSRHVPAAIVAGSHSALAAHRAIGYRAPLMLTIHNGVDATRFSPDSDARASRRAVWRLDPDVVAIGYLARVAPVKAHDDLLSAVASLVEMPGLPPWRLVLVGAGTAHGDEPLTTMIRDAGLEGHVVCAGPEQNPAAALAGFDIAVSSSRGEGFPNAVAEGLATGLPTVATDVGDTRSLLGDSPYLVPPARPAALATAIAALLRLRPDERRALGYSLRSRMQREFRVEDAIDAYVTLYRRIAAVIDTGAPL